ncbi:MAG: hypothetical protein KF744_13020 [Taibaiella sp.]|nr:hypothetical protein [Taibaiella sp.]
MKLNILLPFALLVAKLASGQTALVRNGHTITISADRRAAAIDPVSHQHREMLLKGRPISIDGNKLYTTQELSTAPTAKDRSGKDIKLNEYIFQALKSTIESLDNGYYVPDITDVVIDSTGKLIYWQFTGIKEFHLTHGDARYNYSDLPLADSSIPTDIQQTLKEQATAILQHFPHTTPGTIKNRPVNVAGDLFSKGNYIEVRDHKATLHQDYWSL